MPTASNRDKSGKASKKLGGSKTATNETPVSSKGNPAPAKSRTGNTKETRPTPQATKAAAKPAAKPATAIKPAGKPMPARPPQADPIPTTTGATGRDHPSQSEHAHRLYEKLHGTSAQRTNVPGPKTPGGPKKGFDPNQFRGHQRGFGGGANMIRRTQGRGGGSGSGGGGSA